MVLFTVIVVCLLGVVLNMAGTVRNELSQLATARSDNIQWMFSQSEIELLRFDAALARTDAGEVGELANVRKSFDIFYSRIKTLENSPVFSEQPDDPRFQTGLKNAQSFLHFTAPILDGPDQVFFAANQSFR